MSDLRIRIAAVLKRQFGVLASDHDADELIRELGLMEDEEMDIASTGQPRFYRRYVTEWTVNG